MTAIVVPFGGLNGKRRLAPARDEARAALALAMLADVLAACGAVGRTVVVTGDEAARTVAVELGVAALDDPGGGQGRAVGYALALVPVAPTLVVNADVPCVVPDDLRALEAAIPPGGLSVAPAADGTTKALGLADPRLFRPLYGPGGGRARARRGRDPRRRGVVPARGPRPRPPSRPDAGACFRAAPVRGDGTPRGGARGRDRAPARDRRPAPDVDRDPRRDLLSRGVVRRAGPSRRGRRRPLRGRRDGSARAWRSRGARVRRADPRRAEQPPGQHRPDPRGRGGAESARGAERPSRRDQSLDRRPVGQGPCRPDAASARGRNDPGPRRVVLPGPPRCSRDRRGRRRRRRRARRA